MNEAQSYQRRILHGFEYLPTLVKLVSISERNLQVSRSSCMPCRSLRPESKACYEHIQSLIRTPLIKQLDQIRQYLKGQLVSIYYFGLS